MNCCLSSPGASQVAFVAQVKAGVSSDRLVVLCVGVCASVAGSCGSSAGFEPAGGAVVVPSDWNPVSGVGVFFHRWLIPGKAVLRAESDSSVVVRSTMAVDDALPERDERMVAAFRS